MEFEHDDKCVCRIVLIDLIIIDQSRLYYKYVALLYMFSIGWNNLAVTQLYLGRMRDAVSALEQVIKQPPLRVNTSDSVVHNLAVLYGHETSKSLGKKILLLEHVAKVCTFTLSSINTIFILSTV